jgi:spore coat polysaccharide biosynthesis predicted glycosyltransferase SpsG
VPRPLAFRCDGDALVGAGHVARCIPLAAAFAAAGWSPVFVGEYGGLADWLLARSGLPRTAPQAGPCGLGDGWADAVVDSYALTHDELCAAAARRPQATIGEARRCAGRGVVLDYHVDAPVGEVARLPADRVVAGPGYAPLDPRLAAARRPRPAVERVLVTVGGSDHARRVVPQIVDLVRDAFPGAAIVVPAGADVGPDVEILPAPTALVDVLADVDVAVSAAGVTAYELACAGVPALVVALVDNQQRVARACDAAGIAIGLDGLASDLAAGLRAGVQRLADPGVRSALAEAGPRVFDGHGAARAAREIERRWVRSGLAQRPDGPLRSPING